MGKSSKVALLCPSRGHQFGKDSNREISLQADVMPGDRSPQRGSWKLYLCNRSSKLRQRDVEPFSSAVRRMWRWALHIHNYIRHTTRVPKNDVGRIKKPKQNNAYFKFCGHCKHISFIFNAVLITSMFQPSYSGRCYVYFLAILVDRVCIKMRSALFTLLLRGQINT